MLPPIIKHFPAFAKPQKCQENFAAKTGTGRPAIAAHTAIDKRLKL
jgi:hypothetical protein